MTIIMRPSRAHLAVVIAHCACTTTHGHAAQVLYQQRSSFECFVGHSLACFGGGIGTPSCLNAGDEAVDTDSERPKPVAKKDPDGPHHGEI